MTQFARLLTFAFLVACFAAVAGCTSNSPNGNVAQIRAVDASPNGGTATLFINEGTASGTQTFFQASPYLFIGSGAAGFQFSLSNAPNTAFTAANANMVAGSVYSAVIVGRADVTDEIDARFPRLLVIQDDTGPVAANSAAVRVLNAAPDSPNIDLLVGGNVVESSITYAHNSGYVSIPAGVRSVQVNQTGTNTVLAGPQNLSFTVGKHYTVYFTEPDVATPTFGIQLVNDNP